MHSTQKIAENKRILSKTAIYLCRVVSFAHVLIFDIWILVRETEFINCNIIKLAFFVGCSFLHTRETERQKKSESTEQFKSIFNFYFQLNKRRRKTQRKRIHLNIKCEAKPRLSKHIACVWVNNVTRITSFFFCIGTTIFFLHIWGNRNICHYRLWIFADDRELRTNISTEMLCTHEFSNAKYGIRTSWFFLCLGRCQGKAKSTKRIN